MWLLPSKGRPHPLARFFAACRITSASTEGVVIIDFADWSARRTDYEALTPPPGWEIRGTEAVTQGDKIREIWPEIEDRDWFGLIGDDNIPETPMWDRRLIERLNGWNIVSCNDGWQAPNRLGNCWVMAGPLVRLVGGVFPSGLQHLFVDDVWELLGRETGCWECLMDVTVRHAHVMKGEAPVDATHIGVYGEGFIGGQGPDREHGLWAKDEAIYRRWLIEDAPRLVAAIREARA